jgi:hypothetical protein
VGTAACMIRHAQLVTAFSKVSQALLLSTLFGKWLVSGLCIAACNVFGRSQLLATAIDRYVTYLVFVLRCMVLRSIRLCLV